MTRPAQPGDLAWLICSPESGNDRRIVRVGRPWPAYEMFVHNPEVMQWLRHPGFIVTSQGTPINLFRESSLLGKLEKRSFSTVIWRADRLIPILDEPGQDEALTWKAVPTALRQFEDALKRPGEFIPKD